MRIIDGLDELESLVGTELGISNWVTATQDMVNAFSEVTGDRQWIHLDVERARRELAVGGPIVQGLLTLSLVRGTQTLLSATRTEPGVLRLTSSMVVEAQAVEKPACVAETVSFAYA